MDGKSLDILNEKIAKLKGLIPEAFTEDKIDWEKLRLTLGENLNLSEERYHLNWAGKSEVFRVLQQRTSATLVPQKDESVNFDQTENLFIEGENLEVLKALQKSYFGKVKMIYIDPPYNTGNDSFIYPDRFYETKDEYLKRIGDKDEEGYLLKEGMFRKNSRDGGHYHSNWLSMMYPRLYLARNLLRDDGVIFVSIDDNEVHNLRMIMNEIFGEENFLAQIVWQRAYAPINLKKYFSEMHDYILVYSKNIQTFTLNPLPRTTAQDKDYKNPDNDPRGPWKVGNLSVGPPIEKQIYEIVTPSGRKVMPPKGYCWRYTKERFNELVKDNRIWFGKDGDNVPTPKIFLSEVKKGITPTTWWGHKDAGHNQDSLRELRNLFEDAVFDNPKPVKLIKRLLHLGMNSEENDLILDFFAGSGTTAQAVMELNKEDGGNRKFILVQLPENTDENSEAYKAGYKTIADICKERIRRVINKLSDENKEQSELDLKTNEKLDLGFKAFKLAPSNFKLWRSDVIENGEDLEKMIDIFDDQVKAKAEKENMLYELVLKSGYPLTVKIEKVMLNGGEFYSIAESETIILLEKITQQIIDEIIKLKPKNVISLDRIFPGTTN